LENERLTYGQLLAGKRRRNKGSLNALQKSLWLHIKATEESLLQAMADDDFDRVLRCGHAIAQLAGAYRSVHADADLEARIKALEDATKS
jgi:hypothetical protein